MKAAIVFVLLALAVAAQDPAPGWLAYATATCPPGTRVTHMEANWNVLSNPRPSGAFYSPWFGIDTTDNLNLLQPVNPWLGDQWVIYTEYYQWSPTNNENSNSVGVKAGDLLKGQITFLGEDKQKYSLVNEDVTTSRKSSMEIPVQRKNWVGDYKNYTVLYIVFEKVANCADYPPNGKVTFSNITVFCNGEIYKPQWKTSWVDEVCDFRANVIDPETVSITWSTEGKNPPPEMFERNNRGHLTKPSANIH